MRGVKGKESKSLVTWSSLAAMSKCETAEEMGSVSEEDVSMSESSCSGTPIASKLRRLRESQMKSATKTPRSAMGAEQNVEECILVKPTEFEEMVELMKGAYEDLKNTVRRLHLISKKNPKIHKLASAANTKTDETWGKLMVTLNKKGRKGKRRVERPEEIEVSTQTSPLMEKIVRRKGDGSRKISLTRRYVVQRGGVL